ncbi:MAG: membrane protein insertion efficiency factor YidD [Candidatus Obscuribacterales bacterium]|nr:membrane protein insertion efficiency factor YidD [Candidatus Obscuribacterales bacterium]
MRFKPANLLNLIAVFLVRCWQKTRILRRPSCRFYPSCSEYALGCILRHGFAKGLVASSWRLLRCNPWSPGGIDDVPETMTFRSLFFSRQTEN